METRNSRIKEALKHSGVSTDKLGAYMEMSGAAVRKRLGSKKEIESIEFIAVVASATGFSTEWLFSGNGPKTKKEKINTELDRITVSDDGGGLKYNSELSLPPDLKIENERLKEALRKVTEIIYKLNL